MKAFEAQTPGVKKLTKKQTTKVVGGNENGATGYDIVIVWASEGG